MLNDTDYSIYDLQFLLLVIKVRLMMKSVTHKHLYDIYLYSDQVNGDQDQTDGPHPKCCPLYLIPFLDTY